MTKENKPVRTVLSELSDSDSTSSHAQSTYSEICNEGLKKYDFQLGSKLFDIFAADLHRRCTLVGAKNTPNSTLIKHEYDFKVAIILLENNLCPGPLVTEIASLVFDIRKALQTKTTLKTLKEKLHVPLRNGRKPNELSKLAIINKIYKLRSEKHTLENAKEIVSDELNKSYDSIDKTWKRRKGSFPQYITDLEEIIRK